LQIIFFIIVFGNVRKLPKIGTLSVKQFHIIKDWCCTIISH